MENLNDISHEDQAHGYENAQPSFDLTVMVESSVSSAGSLITTLLDAVKKGDLDAEVSYGIFDAIEKALKKAKDKVKADAIDRVSNLNIKCSSGFAFEFKNGSKKLQYNEDLVFNELSERLKSRQDLLKVALSSKELIFDSEGNEVMKVSVKFDADSISVKLT